MATDEMGYIKSSKRRPTEMINVYYDEKPSNGDLKSNRPKTEMKTLPANSYKYKSLPRPDC